MGKTLINIKEIPREVGIGPARINKWIEKGVIPVRKVGKGTYITSETLLMLKTSAPELVKLFETVEATSQELEMKIQANLEDIRQYQREMAMRGETIQRINLYMETFGSLIDVIYEGKFEEREYRVMQLFLKGVGVKDIAESLSVSPPTVISDLRKCNNVLFNLKPYAKLQKEVRNCKRRLRSMETEQELLSAKLKNYRKLLPKFNEVEEKRDLDLLMTPLSQFQMSTRLTNILKALNINMLGDLATLSEKQLRSFRQFGPTGIKEVKELLESKGLELETEIPWWEDFRGKRNLSKWVVAEEMQEDKSFIPRYLNNLLEDLPEDRANELRNMYEGLASTVKKSSLEKKEYKAKNKELRDKIALLEYDQQHGNLRLSPTYDDVKTFFCQAKEHYEKKKADELTNFPYTNPYESLGKSIRFLDQIFCQDYLPKLEMKAEELQSQVFDRQIQITKLEHEVHRLKRNSLEESALDCIKGLCELVDNLRQEIQKFNKKNIFSKLVAYLDDHRPQYNLLKHKLSLLDMILKARDEINSKSKET